MQLHRFIFIDKVTKGWAAFSIYAEKVVPYNDSPRPVANFFIGENIVATVYTDKYEWSDSTGTEEWKTIPEEEYVCALSSRNQL